MWIKPFDRYVESALDVMGMTHCNPNTSPKLGKAHVDGDDAKMEEPVKYWSAVCTLIHPRGAGRSFRQWCGGFSNV